MKKTYLCEVISNTLVSEGVISLFVARHPDMEPIHPGQFFNLKCGEGDYPLLRRPISVSFSSDRAIEFTVIVKGQGTQLLQGLKPGDKLDLLGPLGNGYDLERPMKHALIVGGGIGVAPQMELTRVLQEKGVYTKVLLGFRGEPYGLETYFNYCNDVEMASETSILGYRGFVTDLVDKALTDEPFDMVFACGPHLMIQKVQEICSKHQIPVQLLMEERMACGVGACLVCTCGVKDGEGRKNVRTCKEGPVFWGDEVIFDE